ncbi:hypothetical protein [Sphingobacterium lactis]|uniref:Phosphoenolpyruvate carboxykinase n=1 Tax=Sphingobacterium lactis TaxID=797291 RepID=A0A1H6CLH7_9SPHI|nr:hypothetical protein [Sphingobacterium lactis]SEG73276.1 hypothetical protein SAMN05421877_11650 [Sphingobacterium lactis]
MPIVHYIVAENLLSIDLPEGVDVDQCLPSFVDFKVSEVPSGIFQINLKVVFETTDYTSNNPKLLSDISIVWGDRFKFEEDESYYITSVENMDKSDKRIWQMLSSKNFHNSTIYAREEDIYQTNILSWLVMVAFGQSVLANDTALIHASVVSNAAYGVAFLGKSGTGKSTHSRLWIKHNAGFRLLNDDNPAIRIQKDGSARIYGTPWSGKTPCYINKSLPLKAIVRLDQAPNNQFVWKNKGAQGLLTLLPSFTALRWNKTIFSSMINILENIMHTVAVGHLYCLPDEGAATLCYQEINNINNLNNE